MRLLINELMRHYLSPWDSVWFMWKVTEDINHKFFVKLEF